MTPKPKTSLAILVGLSLMATLSASAARQQPEAGRKVYEREKCATCHQIEKRGNGRYPLDGVASRLKSDQIRRWLTHPAEMEAALPRMPALRMSTMKYRLSRQELDALVAYMETLK
jgi:mono/diheme cytochrome c family protein